MKTRSFFGTHVPSFESLDYDHSDTIPDDSLTVREILTQFTRGGRVLPDIETGDDDDIDGYDDNFDDMVDAVDAHISAIDDIRQAMAMQKFQEHVDNEGYEDNNSSDDMLK